MKNKQNITFYNLLNNKYLPQDYINTNINKLTKLQENNL